MDEARTKASSHEARPSHLFLWRLALYWLRTYSSIEKKSCPIVSRVFPCGGLHDDADDMMCSLIAKVFVSPSQYLNGLRVSLSSWREIPFFWQFGLDSGVHSRTNHSTYLCPMLSPSRTPVDSIKSQNSHPMNWGASALRRIARALALISMWATPKAR